MTRKRKVRAADTAPLNTWAQVRLRRETHHSLATIAAMLGDGVSLDTAVAHLVGLFWAARQAEVDRCRAMADVALGRSAEER